MSSRTAAFLLTFSLLGDGCEPIPRDLVVDRTISTPHASVHEQIERIESFPDDQYERGYEVAWGGARRAIGGYRDEGSDGVVIAPFERGETLVILSGAHVALVGPLRGPVEDATVRWFMPYDAPCFVARMPGVNGHYDLVALDVTIERHEVRARYGEDPRRRTDDARTITFASRDGGQHFDCE